MPRARTPRNENSLTKQGAAATAVAFAPETRKDSVPVELEAEIRRRAYQLYEERGSVPGHENDDWLVAEREVLGRYSKRQNA